jgi:hypothetical protein
MGILLEVICIASILRHSAQRYSLLTFSVTVRPTKSQRPKVLVRWVHVNWSFEAHRARKSSKTVAHQCKSYIIVANENVSAV